MFNRFKKPYFYYVVSNNPKFKYSEYVTSINISSAKLFTNIVSVIYGLYNRNSIVLKTKELEKETADIAFEITKELIPIIKDMVLKVYEADQLRHYSFELNCIINKKLGKDFFTEPDCILGKDNLSVIRKYFLDGMEKEREYCEIVLAENE